MGAEIEKKDAPGFHYGKSDLIRIGLFSEPIYLSSLGETYKSKKIGLLDYRAMGKQFLTQTLKKGIESKEAYFNTPFIRLFEGEKYMDQVKLRRGWRLKAKEKNIVNAPFKPSSVSAKPSGKGSIWGTIEHQFPIKGKDNLILPQKPLPKEPQKKVPELKNFLTSPAKKGSGFGYANVTIGKYYAYESNPYDAAIANAQEERNASRKKMVIEKPFVSQVPNSEYFNSFARLGKESGEDKKAAVVRKKKAEPLVPFKPTSAFSFTINPYPSYETPKRQPKPSTPVTRNLIFKPSGVTGSFPIRSIVESNTPIAPPNWLRAMQTKVNLGGKE